MNLGVHPFYVDVLVSQLVKSLLVRLERVLRNWLALEANLRGWETVNRWVLERVWFAWSWWH